MQGMKKYRVSYVVEGGPGLLSGSMVVSARDTGAARIMCKDVLAMKGHRHPIWMRANIIKENQNA